ncbi:hypothetical protein A2U01_0098334, partial [Trifolium medium]|nr:hypothetical protein [Trifolium medium]
MEITSKPTALDEIN